jgi:hypothetical protein
MWTAALITKPRWSSLVRVRFLRKTASIRTSAIAYGANSAPPAVIIELLRQDLLVIDVAIARSRTARTRQFATLSCGESSSTNGASGKIASRKRWRAPATRIIASIQLGFAFRKSYLALRFAQATEARTPYAKTRRRRKTKSLAIGGGPGSVL